MLEKFSEIGSRTRERRKERERFMFEGGGPERVAHERGRKGDGHLKVVILF